MADTQEVSSFLELPNGERIEGTLYYDDDGNPIVETMTCGACGFSWNDALVTGITPTPAGRCPNEYGHDLEEEETSFKIRRTGEDYLVFDSAGDGYGIFETYAEAAEVVRSLFGAGSSDAIALEDLNKAVADALGTVRIAPLDVRLSRLLQGLEKLGVTVR